MKKNNCLYITILILTATLLLVIGCGDNNTINPVPTNTPAPTATPLTGNIQGQIFEADGTTPIANPFIGFFTLSASSLQTNTANPDQTVTGDGQGNYTFTGVPQGDCRIEFWRTQSDYNTNPNNPAGSSNGTVTEGTTTINVQAGTIAPTATPTQGTDPTATPTTPAASWKVVTPTGVLGTPDFSDLSFTGTNTGWLSSSNINNTYKTTDGASNFTESTGDPTLTLSAIHMVSETEGYCGGSSGFVYRTTDGGTNWSFLGTITNTLTDITFPPSGGTGYACGLNGVIYSVTSSGVSAMVSGVNGDLASITFPVDSTEGWVCGGTRLLHYTGGNWVSDQVNTTGTWNAIYFVDNQNGWAVGDSGSIIHTTDGKNWTAQTNPDSNSLFDVFFLNPNEGWAVGANGAVLHTTNGGTTWTVEAGGLTTAFLTGVQFTSSTNGYVVGGGKTLLKYD